MRRLISNVMLGLRAALFVFEALALSPIILLMFGVSWLREWIENRWPDSDRAQAVSFWIGLLAPFILCIILIVALCFAIAWQQARYGNK